MSGKGGRAPGFEFRAGCRARVLPPRVCWGSPEGARAKSRSGAGLLAPRRPCEGCCARPARNRGQTRITWPKMRRRYCWCGAYDGRCGVRGAGRHAPLTGGAARGAGRPDRRLPPPPRPPAQWVSASCHPCTHLHPSPVVLTLSSSLDAWDTGRLMFHRRNIAEGHIL